MGPEDDAKMMDLGMGFTEVVARPTRGSKDLTTAEIKEGSLLLKAKMQLYKPKVAVFNGKAIYQVK